MDRYRSEISIVVGTPGDTRRPDSQGQMMIVQENNGTDDTGDCGADDDRGPIAAQGNIRGCDARFQVSVQRSRSDVRHETRTLSILQQTKRRGSNFELAFLLERGRSLDAKLFGGQEDESAGGLRRGSLDELDELPAGPRAHILILPIRLKQALTKRRFSSSSRAYPSRKPMCDSLQESTVRISGPLDSLPELSPTEMLCYGLSVVTHANRVKDIDMAISWLQQEIRSLKQQDRKLFRQLLDLGTEIHRLSGMALCQSCSMSLDIDDVDDNDDAICTDAVNWNGECRRATVDLALGVAQLEDDDQWQSNTTSEVNALKNNKFIDLCNSLESFF